MLPGILPEESETDRYSISFMSRLPQNKKIVFVNQSAGYLTIDIINQFSDAGYKCDLITGLLVTRSRSISKSVKVRRIIKYNNTNHIRRIFTWGWASFQIFIIILFKYRNSHIFFFTNPPLAPLTSLILPNSYSIVVFDVYPEAISELGFLPKNSFIIKLWKNANTMVYRQAEDVFTITQGMKDLISLYPMQNPAKIVNLWADNDFLHYIPKENNPFIKKYDLTGKFVVLYSGKIGFTSDVEILCDVAEAVNDDNVRFVIIGEGSRKKSIEQRINSSGLKDSFTILPLQEVNMLPYTLSSADLGVVILSKAASQLSIPSKTFSLLAIGVPILGITGDESDLNVLINQYRVGRCYNNENVDGIVKFIRTLVNNRSMYNEFRNNALLTSELFTRKNAENFVNNHD